MNLGSSNRMQYDTCAYQKRLFESTSPLAYQLYQGKFENCNKPTANNKFYAPFDLVDEESELKGLGRPLSKCDNFKYNSQCPRSKLCVSTFDKDNKVVLAPEVQPIIHNNIPKMSDVGYKVPDAKVCENIQ